MSNKVHIEEARKVYVDLMASIEFGGEQLWSEMALCGSIRREREWVHDIDLVMRPTTKDIKVDLLTIKPYVLMSSWAMGNADREAPAGTKATFKYVPKNPVGIYDTGRKKLTFFYHGLQVDVYYAWGEADFWPQVLIRTGPAEQNAALAKRAIDGNMKLSMGPGLRVGGQYDINAKGKRVYIGGYYAGYESEQAMFNLLHLPFCPAPLRDHPQWLRLIRSRKNWPPKPGLKYLGDVWKPERKEYVL